jgi:fatty acid desaturase
MDPRSFDVLILTTAIIISLMCGVLWTLVLAPLIGVSSWVFIVTFSASLFVLLTLASE